jgi:hydroxyacylglutathione hydrolase
MENSIQRIDLGLVNCFLIKGNKWIMIDTGIPGQMASIKRYLERKGIALNEIELIILSHAHFDHAGNAYKLKEKTGAKIAIHQLDKGWLEAGQSLYPKGRTLLGKILSSIGRSIPSINFTPVIPDIIVSDEGMSLEEYGIPGRIIHTPGHTSGSTSVLLETGDALVGDLAMSARFMQFSPGLSIFAENEDNLASSLDRLINAGVKMIYPAHGRPFSADVFK